MTMQDMEKRIVAAIQTTKAFAGIPVFAVDIGDIVKNTEQAIAKNHFCITVDAANFTDEAPDSAVCYGTLKVEISIFEHVIMNRRGENSLTCSVAAQELCKRLKLFDTGDGVLTNPAISSPNDLANGIIAQTLSFTMKTTL